jgi:hypothetical protein
VRAAGVQLVELVHRGATIAPWLYIPPVVALATDKCAAVADKAVSILKFYKQVCSTSLLRSHAAWELPMSWHCIQPMSSWQQLCRVKLLSSVVHDALTMQF